MIFSMLKGIYTMPPHGDLWVMVLKNIIRKLYICTFLSGPSLHLNYFYLQKLLAEFTPKLFLPAKTSGRVYT
jgi:hypothetical protein